MARVLIAGCGDVGTVLSLRLAEAGHEVWGLRRHTTDLPSPIRSLAADLGDPATLTVLPSGLEAVFYTAAAGGFDEARYRAAYVEGVRNLVDTLHVQDQPVRRVFLASSTSVYGQTGGEWVDEHSPAAADTFAGRSLREGEALLWNGPYPATVVRFGGIYGPGRIRLIDTLKSGTATCSEGLYTNRIHRDDAAAALAHLLALPDPAPLYLGVDDDPASQCEVLGWLAERLGVPGPGVSPAPRERRRSNKRCRNARLRASGFDFQYPSYREGYAALLD